MMFLIFIDPANLLINPASSKKRVLKVRENLLKKYVNFINDKPIGRIKYALN